MGVKRAVRRVDVSVLLRRNDDVNMLYAPR